MNVLPTRCQPFSVHVFFLLASTSSTSQMGRSSRRRTYIYLAHNASLSDSPMDTFPLYNTLSVQKPPACSTESVRAPDLLYLITLPETGPLIVATLDEPQEI